MTATYTKLRSGDWGIRVPGGASKGQTVQVKTKAGDIKEETVSNVLWTGKDTKTGQTISLCAIQDKPRASSNSKYQRTGCSCGSRDGIIQETDCWQCRHDAS